MSGRRLQAYGDEMPWRENRSRAPNGTLWGAITAAALAHPKSGIWAGYWHRKAAWAENDESNHSANKIIWNAPTNTRAKMILEIEQLEKRIAELKARLLHLDGTLRIFGPDFAAEGLPLRHRRRTKSPCFEHGEVTERIYDAKRGQGPRGEW